MRGVALTGGSELSLFGRRRTALTTAQIVLTARESSEIRLCGGTTNGGERSVRRIEGIAIETAAVQHATVIRNGDHLEEFLLIAFATARYAFTALATLLFQFRAAHH